MKTIVCLLIGSMAAGAAVATDEPRSSNAEGAGTHRMADVNRDGLLTRDEYMKHAAKMWSSMPKDSKGKVYIASVESGTVGCRGSMESQDSRGSRSSTDSNGSNGMSNSTRGSGTGAPLPTDPVPRSVPNPGPTSDPASPGAMTTPDNGSTRSSDTTRR